MKQNWMRFMKELGLTDHCLPIQIFDFTAIVILSASVIALVPMIVAFGF